MDVALAAIALQSPQWRWGTDTSGSLDQQRAHANHMEETMAWNVPLNQLANTSRRKVLATSVMSAISLSVRSSTAAGEEPNRSQLSLNGPIQ